MCIENQFKNTDRVKYEIGSYTIMKLFLNVSHVVNWTPLAETTVNITKYYQTHKLDSLSNLLL
jgi:hypothetical protein